MLERQLSSAGCSTSYAKVSDYATCRRLSNSCRTSRIRCASQQKSYHGSHSPERDSSRKHVSPRRASGSVAASAAAVAPPSSSRDGVRSLPPDLISSIPDAMPSLEDLEDLRHRAAMHVTLERTRRTVIRSSSADGVGQPAQRRNAAHEQPADLEQSAQPQTVDHRKDVGAMADAEEPTSGLRRHGRTQLPRGVQPESRSALSQVVLPPPQPERPQPPRGQPPGGTNIRPHLSNLSRRVSFEGRHPGMQATMAIKAVRDWRQLPGLLAGLGPGGLDPFSASAFLAHLAQRVAASPPASQADVAVIERMQAAALSVVEENMHEYRARQISNMTWALARLGLPSGASFLREHLVAASYPLMPWYEPQHLSITLWALAAVGVAPDDGWLEEYLTAAFVMLQRRAFEPQHLANVLWALERLGVMPDQEWMAAYYDCVAAAAPLANGQDCSNILASLALLGMYEHQPQATVALVERLDARMQQLLTMDAGMGESRPAGGNRDKTGARGGAPTVGRRGSSTSPAAALGSPSEMPAGLLTPMPIRATDAGAGVVSEPEASASWVVSDQSLSNSTWALAVMGMPPSDALWEGVTTALRRRLMDTSPSQVGVQNATLSILLWAASTLKRALPPGVMSALYGKVRAAQMAEMEPRSLATMVWAVATAPPEQARPPQEWVSEVVAASLRSVPQLSAQSVSNMLYGLHALNARPPPVWMSAVINHFHRSLAEEASSQSISNLLWCLTKMGYKLNSEGMDIMFGLVQARLEVWQGQQRQQQQQQRRGSQGLPGAKPSAAGDAKQQSHLQDLPEPPFNSQEVSNLLYSMAGMDYRIDPAGPLAQLLLEAAQARLQEANAEELSTIVWSLASLQIRPSDTWVLDFCAAAEARLPSFKPRDLAQTLYGAAKLRLPLYAPPAPVPAAAITPGGLRHLGSHISSEDGDSHTGIPAVSAPLSSSPAVASWLVAAMAAAPGLIGASNAQDLCNLSWALVQLGLPVAPNSRLAAAFASRLAALSRSCEPPLLALGVWALGKWQLRPTQAQLEQLQVATFRQVQAMRPHELAAMLSGFAGMRHAPPAEWQEEVLQCVASRSKEFGPQDWTVVVLSLSRLMEDDSVKPQLEELLGRLQKRLDRMPLPSLILLAYSCGCIGPSHATRVLVWRCLALVAAGDSAERVQAEDKAPGSRGSGGKGQPDGAEQARPVAVSSLTPVELSSLLWSAVRVGIKFLPAEFRTQFLRQTQPLIFELPASLVSSYLWAAGRLRMWLPITWQRLMVVRVRQVLRDMRGKELGMCMAGMMWLRIGPGPFLLSQLSEHFEGQRSEMPASLSALAQESLRVFQKRRRLLKQRERFDDLWLSAVYKGNKAAKAQGKGRTAQKRPKGSVSRRAALRFVRPRSRPGVLRRPAAPASPGAPAGVLAI